MTLPNPDLFITYCITMGYTPTYNDGLWDYLTAEGFTQPSLNEKIKAADAASFDWILN